MAYRKIIIAIDCASEDEVAKVQAAAQMMSENFRLKANDSRWKVGSSGEKKKSTRNDEYLGDDAKDHPFPSNLFGNNCPV